MAKFLNTSATNYYLEELIKDASERLILISPFLKVNDRIKELLEDKNRLKIDIRIIYGKSELHPNEINWLKELEFIRISYCKNLHAKCYMNEESCIITSLNLYEFSQINNNEMSIYLTRENDPEAYRDTYDEVHRIIRVSDEIRMSLEKVELDTPSVDNSSRGSLRNTTNQEPAKEYEKKTTSRLAIKLKMKTPDLIEKLTAAGYLTLKGKQHRLTKEGEAVGGEFRQGRHGWYFIWPNDLKI